MKIFIWSNLMKVSRRYHSEGGLVVVAESLEAAREIIREQVDAPKDVHSKALDCDAKTTEPDEVFDVGEAKEYFCVFPNAGCC
jgi:hypothetical protein